MSLIIFRGDVLGGIYVGDVSIGTNALNIDMEILGKIIWKKYVKKETIGDKMLYMFRNVKDINMRTKIKIK